MAFPFKQKIITGKCGEMAVPFKQKVINRKCGEMAFRIAVQKEVHFWVGMVINDIIETLYGTSLMLRSLHRLYKIKF